MVKQEEDHDIALVNMKRQIETNKAERMQANLHMMDLDDDEQPKRLKIKFINSLDEIKSEKLVPV